MLEDVVQTEQGNSPKEIYLSSYGRISSEAFGGNYQLVPAHNGVHSQLPTSHLGQCHTYMTESRGPGG